jgi:hypothetical protein
VTRLALESIVPTDEDRAASYVQRWGLGRFAVRYGGSNRALFVVDSIEEGVARAKQRGPGRIIYVERSERRRTKSTARWRKA